MRILVVIPHYFGPSHPANSSPTIGSYVEPLGRIAALNDTIVALHRHFGQRGLSPSGAPVLEKRASDCLHIVIVTKRGHGLLDELGLSKGSFEVEYADCDAPWLAFCAQRIFRDRQGQYDFYCYLEDDVSIYDPAFFDKLAWFQQCFGPRALLQPIRYELPKAGTLTKCVVDPDLPASYYAPFRRIGQLAELEGVWNGRKQVFSLPSNPHSACFFLSDEQLAYWVRQPTFDDGDDSWVGPLESAATYSIGRVFDLYKPCRPDAFFLEVEHFGTRYASSYQADGARYSESPLLAVAQNAVQTALDGASLPYGSGLSRILRESIEAGTATELRGRLDRLERQAATQKGIVESLTTDAERKKAETARLERPLKRLRSDRLRETRSLRWLFGTLRRELFRRCRNLLHSKP